MPRLRALGWQKAEPQEKPAFKERLEQALDPLSAIYNAGVAWMYHFARRDDEVIVHARKSLELDPAFAIGLVRLGVAYRHLGRFDLCRPSR